jgi:uncharacterized protein DUF2752
MHLRTRRVATGLSALLVGAALIAALPLCPLANLTGWPCPGCGITRALLALLHGNLGQALAIQPLSPLIGLLLAVYLGGGWLGYVRTGEPTPPWTYSHPRVQRVLACAAAVTSAALVLLWLARFAGLCGGPVPVQARWLDAVLALR